MSWDHISAPSDTKKICEINRNRSFQKFCSHKHSISPRWLNSREGNLTSDCQEWKGTLTYILDKQDSSSTCNPHWHWQEMQKFFCTCSTSSRTEGEEIIISPQYWSEPLMSRAFISHREVKLPYRYSCKNSLCFIDGVCETDWWLVFSFPAKECQNSNCSCLSLCSMILTEFELTLKLVLLWMGIGLNNPQAFLPIWSHPMILIWFMSFSFPTWTCRSGPDTIYCQALCKVSA